MHKAIIVFAAGTALLSAPAVAQIGGVVGGSVDATVGTGPVAGTVNNLTGQVGNTVDHADGAVNGAIDLTKLVAATREQVRAGAQITDTQGNSIGTVQSVDGANAVIVDGGKLYNIPLAEIYSKADSVTGPLVTKMARSEIRASVHGGAAAGTHDGMH